MTARHFTKKKRTPAERLDKLVSYQISKCCDIRSAGEYCNHNMVTEMDWILIYHMSKAASFGPNTKAFTRALKMILLLLVGR